MCLVFNHEIIKNLMSRIKFIYIQQKWELQWMQIKLQWRAFCKSSNCDEDESTCNREPFAKGFWKIKKNKSNKVKQQQFTRAKANFKYVECCHVAWFAIWGSMGYLAIESLVLAYIWCFSSQKSLYLHKSSKYNETFQNIFFPQRLFLS